MLSAKRKLKIRDCYRAVNYQLGHWDTIIYLLYTNNGMQPCRRYLLDFIFYINLMGSSVQPSQHRCPDDYVTGAGKPLMSLEPLTLKLDSSQDLAECPSEVPLPSVTLSTEHRC